MKRFLLTVGVLVAAGLPGVVPGSGPAAGQPWGLFGGDQGRSGHQPVEPGTAPVENRWSATGPETRDVLTSVLATGGPPAEQRVVYGTGDRRNTEGATLGGRVHIRKLLDGAPVTPPEGIKVSDEPDAFGDGLGSISFADTSTDTELGFVWMVYNDTNGVSVAQIDEATGKVVQIRLPDPADINDKLVGITVNSSVLMAPPNADGDRALLFVAFADVDTIETLYKITLHNPGRSDARFGPITTANGDFNLVDFASPSVVYLTANASNNEAHVAVGDCRGRLYTFAVDDLAPGPIAPVGAASDCVLTASAPVTPAGRVPGEKGSGLVRSPVIYVATIDAQGETTRVHRLIQETSIEFRREPDNPPVLPGGAAGGLALDAVVLPSGTLEPGGRVYVSTGRNLFVLDARDLTNILARLDPNDSLVPGDTGFSLTSPAVSGNLLFVTRDNGEQLVLDKRTLAPITGAQFTRAEAGGPAEGSFARGQVAIAHRQVTYGTSRGVFSYNLRAATPPPGYWLAASDGGIFAFGAAGFFGSTGAIRLNQPIVGMAPTPTGQGYWLVARDGGIFAFGDAAFAGSAAGTTLSSPIAAMAATPTGKGYWLAAADGAVFAFGDAVFHGSAGGTKPAPRIVGMAATVTGKGYWLAGADGAVFAYGDAADHGSMAGRKLTAPVVGIAPLPTGNGYWLAARDGGIFTFGSAGFHGSTGAIKLNSPMIGIGGGPSGFGYSMVATDGGVFSFGDATFWGSTGAIKLNAPVVAIGMVS